MNVSKIKMIEEKIKNNDYLAVTISTIFASGISFLFSVIARRCVIPFEYGIYSTCILLNTYFNYAQLGVLNSYNRDLPRLIGSRDVEKIEKLRYSTLNYFILTYVIIACVIIFLLTIKYRSGNLDSRYYIGYIFVMIFLIIDNISSFGMNTTRAYGGFLYSSVVIIIRAISSFSIGLFALWKLGYYGIYIMPLSGALISVLFYKKEYLYKWKPFIDYKIIKESIKTGFPLMISSFIWTLMSSVDKFIILFFMSTETLGIYSVPQIGFSTMILIPQSIAQVFYIRLSNEYGKTCNEEVLIELGNKYTKKTSIYTSVIAVIAFYMLPIFIKLVMPNYLEGIIATQILLVGVAVYGTTMLYGNILSVLRLNRMLIINSIILCLFNIIFSTGLVVVQGKNINNVALGTSISYALYSLLMLTELSWKFKKTYLYFLKDSWMIVITMILPSIVMYILLPFKMACVISFAMIGLILCVNFRRKNVKKF